MSQLPKTQELYQVKMQKYFDLQCKITELQSSAQKLRIEIDKLQFIMSQPNLFQSCEEEEVDAVDAVADVASEKCTLPEEA